MADYSKTVDHQLERFVGSKKGNRFFRWSSETKNNVCHLHINFDCCRFLERGKRKARALAYKYKFKRLCFRGSENGEQIIKVVVGKV